MLKELVQFVLVIVESLQVGTAFPLHLTVGAGVDKAGC
jgi:hypothetical protein